VDNQTYRLPQPFMVLATQNPIEHHGTYPLPESQLDRFLMRIRIGYPAAESEKEVIRNHTGGDPLGNLKPILEASDVVALQNEVRRVRVDEALMNYVMKMVERSRANEHLSLGVSPRGAMMLYRGAQALAFVEGRAYCLPDDIKRLILPVFAHRVVVSTKYVSTLKRTEQAEAILQDIIESTEVPL
jgi:MoxR-like ATPase